MDIKKLKKCCESIKLKTDKMQTLYQEMCPVKEALKPTIEAIKTPKKKEIIEGGIVYEQKQLVKFIGGINVVQN